jgi:hypothetical protein
MTTPPRNPDSTLDNAGFDSSAGAQRLQPLLPLPEEAANKSEHVPPIIIKSGSFLIDFDFPLIQPTGVINPPYTYQYPYPFALRGIRVVGRPGGTPETLYYALDPNDYRVELELSQGANVFNLTLASVVVNSSRNLTLTTHNHQLPAVSDSGDRDRPRRYQYASDRTIELKAVTIRDANSQILYRTSGTLAFDIGIWRQHGH